MKKLKEIPKCKSLAEEEKFWATHDSTDYIDHSKVELGFFPELKPSSKAISIRLPESLIEALNAATSSRLWRDVCSNVTRDAPHLLKYPSIFVH